ncbi:MAG: hypothetical protein FJY81_00295 [Candidatus Aminicenantes bacterium]|nr:hypothetical protein [Candidatus Aminicenantes bacterium]
MKTQSHDTQFSAERIQLELIRKASVAKRLALVRSLTKTVFELSWQGIRSRYPGEDHLHSLRRFFCLNYGSEELADRFIQRLAERIAEQQ